MDRHRGVDLNKALLLLNDWLGQSVRLLVLIRLGASDELPPSGSTEGWHVVLRLLSRESEREHKLLRLRGAAQQDMKVWSAYTDPKSMF